MTKKGIGLAKGTVMRVFSTDKTRLASIRKELGMNSSHNEGDVLHKLIELYDQKKIGDTPFLGKRVNPVHLEAIQSKITEFNSLLDDRTQEVIRWKSRCEKVSEKTGIPMNEIIELVQ